MITICGTVSFLATLVTQLVRACWRFNTISHSGGVTRKTCLQREKILLTDTCSVLCLDVPNQASTPYALGELHSSVASFDVTPNVEEETKALQEESSSDRKTLTHDSGDLLREYMHRRNVSN